MFVMQAYVRNIQTVVQGPHTLQHVRISPCHKSGILEGWFASISLAVKNRNNMATLAFPFSSTLDKNGHDVFPVP